MTVIVMGDVMVDVVARHDHPLAIGSDTPARTRLSPGGGARNVAAALSAQGTEVALVAATGEDALADLALVGLDASHVRRVPGARTGVCVVLVDEVGERTMLPDPGANLALPRVPGELLARAGVLFVSGYALFREPTRAAACAALEAARAAGVATVVDCASAEPLRGAPEFLTWTGRVDLLLANEQEAVVLGEAALASAGALVVKRGPRGATYRDRERTFDVPSTPIEGADSTGAGDAFAAGLLTAWPGGPVEEALTSAVTTATAVLRSHGV